MTRYLCASLLILSATTAMAAEPPSIGAVWDQQLSMIQSELVPLAEAMPADKYNFAPTQGEFTGARTFGQQVMHIAAVLRVAAAPMLGDKAYDAGKGENGPAGIDNKDAIVKYLKESFEYAHKAAKAVDNANYNAPVTNPFGKGEVSRTFCASLMIWHSFDHYGQLAVYARMNNIVPPASRR